MKKVIASSLTAMTVLLGSTVSTGIDAIEPMQAEAATASYKEKAISEGKKVIGVPYLWGGTTKKGFDCSGFIGYAFNKAGKKLPRTAAQIYKLGKTVQKRNLQRGDLVFFTTYKKGASHLGIYLGSGKFLHSSSSKGVHIGKMSNSYWSKRYIGAKRM